MKLNYTKLSFVLLFAALLSGACKKESSTTKTESENSDNSFLNESKSSCRMLDWRGLDDGYLRKMEYNKRGLLENWIEQAPAASEDYLFTFKYDQYGKISEVRTIDHGTLIYITTPVYKHDRITHELWYLSDGVTLDDSVANLYDRKGQIVRRTSTGYDYITNFIYDDFGNVVRQSSRSAEGFLYDSIEQGYDRNVREPMVAVPGLIYPIPFANYIVSKQKYNRFKEMYDDGTGNIVTAYELDPKSKLIAGPDHYAIFDNTFDLVSQVGNRQVWDYDNCNCNYQKFFFDNNTTFSVLPIKSNAHSPLVTFKMVRERVKNIRVN